MQVHVSHGARAARLRPQPQQAHPSRLPIRLPPRACPVSLGRSERVGVGLTWVGGKMRLLARVLSGKMVATARAAAAAAAAAPAGTPTRLEVVLRAAVGVRDLTGALAALADALKSGAPPARRDTLERIALLIEPGSRSGSDGASQLRTYMVGTRTAPTCKALAAMLTAHAMAADVSAAAQTLRAVAPARGKACLRAMAASIALQQRADAAGGMPSRACVGVHARMHACTRACTLIVDMSSVLRNATRLARACSCS